MMPGYIQCGGCGKASSVIVREDGSRDVIHWRLGDHKVPPVHRVRATLVRFPVEEYVHADYGPEAMACRAESIARLGWSSHSLDLPLVPEVVGHFNLLSEAIATAQTELGRQSTAVQFKYPNTISVAPANSRGDRFRVYLNLPGYEFYHFMFIVGGGARASGHPESHFTADPVDLSTCPKLLKWLKPFETAKKKLYLTNGFDWNPRRGPIEAGPARGDL